MGESRCNHVRQLAGFPPSIEARHRRRYALQAGSDLAAPRERGRRQSGAGPGGVSADLGRVRVYRTPDSRSEGVDHTSTPAACQPASHSDSPARLPPKTTLTTSRLSLRSPPGGRASRDRRPPSSHGPPAGGSPLFPFSYISVCFLASVLLLALYLAKRIL